MYRGVAIYLVVKIGLMLLIREMLKHELKKRQQELNLHSVKV